MSASPETRDTVTVVFAAGAWFSLTKNRPSPFSFTFTDVALGTARGGRLPSTSHSARYTARSTELDRPVNRRYRAAWPPIAQSSQPRCSPPEASTRFVQAAPSSEPSIRYRWTRYPQSQFSSRMRDTVAVALRSSVIVPGDSRFVQIV